MRDWDGERLTIDFVVHGDEGVAGPWAAAAQPGDELVLLGPGGAYTPDPDADWHLMVGDAGVIPAIAASLAAHPGGRARPRADRGRRTRGGAAAHHARRPAPELAARRRRSSTRSPRSTSRRPRPRVRARRGELRARLRRHLLVDRGLPREALSISGYWKRTRTEEGWREDKAEWNRLVEQDATAA